MFSSLSVVAATLIVAAATGVGSASHPAELSQEPGGVLLAVDDTNSPSPTPAPVPEGWVRRSFDPVSLATPPTWEPVVLRGNALRTAANLNEELRRIYTENLKQSNVLGALVDTETLGNSISESFVTEMIVAAQPVESGGLDAEQLATFAREEIYTGPDAPKDVAVTVFEHPTGQAVQARYTYEESGSKGLAVEYMIAFGTHLVFLGLSTDERNPAPDIATGEKIVRTATVN
jgi:hypothetical protein